MSQSTPAKEPFYAYSSANGLPALRLNGSSQFLSRGSNISPGGTYSIVAWMRSTSARTSSTYAGNAPDTVAGSQSGSVNVGFGIGSGHIVYRAFNASWQTVNGVATINDGLMRMIAVTHNGGAGPIVLYANGSSDGAGGSVVVAAPLISSIGGGQVDATFANAQDWFTGDICEILLYNVVLSAGNITTLSNYGKTQWGAQ